MRKTKIVCTMGPSTEKPGILRQLMENGMNVARFNFSHGDYEEHKGRFNALRALSKELDLPVAAMLDTKGPEIRLGTFKNGVEKLVTGQKFTLTSREVEGTNEICSVSYKELPRDVAAGGRIMLDDGLIELGIDEVSDTDIVCTVKNDGTIKTKKGVNVPGVHLSMPYMSNRDRNDMSVVELIELGEKEAESRDLVVWRYGYMDPYEGEIDTAKYSKEQILTTLFPSA